MIQKIEKIPVRIVRKIKSIFKCKTYHVEGMFVFSVLAATAVFSNKGYIEFFGVFAVFFTFMHASIAEYMRETEHHRAQNSLIEVVKCYKKLPYYFYAKEICWCAYFLLLGAFSALIGVFVFLLYQPWRTVWRKYNPR